MAASKTIGGINVTISATIDKFQKAMTMGRRLLGGFVKSIKSTIFSLKGLTAALSLAAFTKLTVNAFNSIDALGELSDKLGVSTEALAGFQLAAQEAGVSNETLERAMVALNKKGFGGESGLRRWIEDTSKLGTQQEKLAAATKMFGSRGSSMVRMLTGGTAALDDARSMAEKLGLALDRASVMGVERAIDAFARMRSAIGGVFRQLAIDIAPFIEVLSDKLTTFLATGGRAKSVGKTIADAIIKTTKFIADAIQSMVGGVLSFVADAKNLMYNIRTSAGGKAFGLGYENNWQKITAEGDIWDARDRARAFNSQPSWSKFIDSAMADARKSAAAQAASAPGSGGLLGRIIGGAGKNLLDDLKKLPQTLGGPQFQMMMRNFAAMTGLGFKMRGHRDLKESGVQVGPLSAQDPTSREGFAQRVRSLAQNGLQKLAQRQLDTQQKMLTELKKKPPLMLAAANLAGG